MTAAMLVAILAYLCGVASAGIIAVVVISAHNVRRLDAEAAPEGVTKGAGQ